MALTWDDVTIEVENLSEEEAAEIESGGKQAVPGLYLCTVVESKPKQIDYKAYSTLGCTLKFQIDKVLEMNGKPVTGDEGEELEGSFLYDDISFAPMGTEGVKEPDWARKRRKMVALRLGLVAPGSVLTKSAWQEEVIGRRVKIKVHPGEPYEAKDAEGNKIYDENGKVVMKVGKPRIGFWDGYIKVDGEVAQQEAWDDI